MDTSEMKKMIDSDPDFVNYPSLGNSLKRVMEVHPNGLSDEQIAKALMISEEEVLGIFAKAVKKLKESLT